MVFIIFHPGEGWCLFTIYEALRAQGLKGMFEVFLFLDFPGERHFRRLRRGLPSHLWLHTTTSTVRDTIEISLVLYLMMVVTDGCGGLCCAHRTGGAYAVRRSSENIG